MSHEGQIKLTGALERRGPAGRAALAAARQSLIDELENVMTNRSAGSRADVLRKVTDLFVSGSDHFNNAQKDLFDEVMGRLLVEIENSARIAFGQRLAAVENAPPKVSRTLALDDSIEVARSVLIHSDHLDEHTLITGAKTKSQEHLLAISQRKLLSQNVTDVLVERGDQRVVRSAAANPGAEFSEFGYSTLVTRAEADGELALAVWSRAEIPHKHLLRLFTEASEAVRLKLDSTDRRKAELINDMVKQAADQIQNEVRRQSYDFGAAEEEIRSLGELGTLTEDRLREFAEATKFEQTTVALSYLSNVPVGAVERALVSDNSDQLLLLARSIGLSWDTTKTILSENITTKKRSHHELEQCYARFVKLKPETALIAMQFYRLRERANKSLQG